ncbi:MAG: hypothetical protein QM802_04055 [Agriterribacter sp.]
MATSHFDYLSCEPFRSWNRLESRPRQSEFDEVLKAGVHDALWMLTRQWQFGEFQGEDTGSAVFAKIMIETTRVNKFQHSDGTITDYDESLPLETFVERMPVLYDVRFRASAGQYWLKLLQKRSLNYVPPTAADAYNHNTIKKVFASVFLLELPVIDHANDNTALQVAKARLLSNKLAHQAISGLTGRTPDGVAWYEALKATGSTVSLPAAITSHADWKPAFTNFVLSAANEFITWFEKSHEHPGNTNDSWAASNLEYSFGCSMPNKGEVGNTVLEAKEYYSGELDWYAFNLELNTDGTGLAASDATAEADLVKTEILTVIPAEARFGGMPNSRWWEFEDGSTDLGNITAETTNLAKILLAQFALMYSNDWFIVPYSVPAGAVSEVKGILVTDTFGERTLVDVAGQGDANDWTGWTMFNFTKTNASEGKNGKTDPRIYIPPVVSKVQESAPQESVEIIRDEMANMVWGVEAIIPDLMGGGQNGHAAAQELQNYFKKLEREEVITPMPVPDGVKLSFSLGNTVPENWIPFLPIHLPNEDRAIQLQRASMPRWFNKEFSQVRPRTAILREGMNNDNAAAEQLFVNASDEIQKTSYFIYEEEAPRKGVIIEAAWQRTRWYNGRTICWYGRKKKTARGEGASGLAFDEVIYIDYADQEALVPAE